MFCETTCVGDVSLFSKLMIVVWSDKGCRFKFLVRLGGGDHAAVFGVLASGAVPGVGA